MEWCSRDLSLSHIPHQCLLRHSHLRALRLPSDRTKIMAMELDPEAKYGEWLCCTGVYGSISCLSPYPRVLCRRPSSTNVSSLPVSRWYGLLPLSILFWKGRLFDLRHPGWCSGSTSNVLFATSNVAPRPVGSTPLRCSRYRRTNHGLRLFGSFTLSCTVFLGTTVVVASVAHRRDLLLIWIQILLIWLRRHRLLLDSWCYRFL